MIAGTGVFTRLIRVDTILVHWSRDNGLPVPLDPKWGGYAQAQTLPAGLILKYTYLFSRLPFPVSLKPLAKGLLSIFSWVILREKTNREIIRFSIVLLPNFETCMMPMYCSFTLDYRLRSYNRCILVGRPINFRPMKL